MRKFAMVMASSLLLALVGCASTGGSKSAMNGSSAFDDDVDYAKMTQITQDALRRGYRIVWIHPPQKPKSPDRGQP
jgi:hypothetical protein